ncbi:unnamed protein product [Durusdinium trenchii]|uniref:Uncharacterized protein n=2 Tax=Durusdinium trenchii TaxID=1381693 RepID=A0ABP0INY8_9DINO
MIRKMQRLLRCTSTTESFSSRRRNTGRRPLPPRRNPPTTRRPDGSEGSGLPAVSKTRKRERDPGMTERCSGCCDCLEVSFDPLPWVLLRHADLG